MRETSLRVFGLALVANGLAWYGGVRSPDGEVVFEVCQALVDDGSFAIREESRWRGFGVAHADGRAWSVFGPGQSIACVPLLAVAQVAEPFQWFEVVSPRPSHYVGNGFEAHVTGAPVTPAPPHARRTIASLLNPLVCAALAALFHDAVVRLLRTDARPSPLAMRVAALATSVLVVGTPLWWYSGTFFSEPLAALCLFGAVAAGLREPTQRAAAVAGLAAGVAVTTHVATALAVPFVLAWVLRPRPGIGRAAQLRAALVGVGAPLALLAVYNVWRFGDPFETGRAVDSVAAAQFGYGHFVAPWRGLYGLLLGPGKGLVIYVPASLVAVIGARALVRREPWLAFAAAGSAAATIGFVAARSDWHGGFCVGPRHLVPLVPIALLGATPWLEGWLDSPRRLAASLGLTLIFIAEQAIFVVGEPFTWFQRVRMSAMAQRVDVFAEDRLYLDWSLAPVLHLLDPPATRGAWVLASLPVGPIATSALLTAVVGAAVVAVVARSRGR